MVAEQTKKRDVAIDFVKVIATLLVMNSHMGMCYGSYSALATGGGIGDALFFFVSGFTLFMGRRDDFVNWYKRRIGRIYPTIIAVGLVACLIFLDDSSFIDVLSAHKYWFLQCILICYIFLYPIIKYNWKLKYCIPISIILMVTSFFTLFDFGNELFYGVNNYFRWIFYFTIMLVGGGVYKIRNRIQYKWWSIPAILVSIILWFGIIYMGKGNDLVLLSYIPLIIICILAYQIGKAKWVENLFNRKIGGNILFIIGNLCLESYMIQKFIFTDALNSIFPLNIPLTMIAVLMSAYAVHILSGIVSQVFDSKAFNVSSLFLYKK